MNNRQADNLFQTASNQESIMPEVIHYPERRRFQIDIDGLEAGYISYTEHKRRLGRKPYRGLAQLPSSRHCQTAGERADGIRRNTQHPVDCKLRLRGAVYRLIILTNTS